MGRFARTNMISFVMCILMWSIIVVSTWSTNFLIPKWAQKMSDENLTGIPKDILQLQDDIMYPTRIFLQNMFNSQSLINKSQKLQKTQNRFLKANKFFCDTNDTRSLTRPTSVHKLKPGDIDIIGGIGDSLTVGTGTFSFIIPHLAIDHRGSSFTSGGQKTWRELLTLPNIIKVFNPKLFGYAYGDATAEQRYSQFNVAEAGALSKDIPFMTRELVKRIKMDKRVNVNEDWKLITLMLSSNTFCLELCYEDNTKLVEKHRESLVYTMLYIREHLPRTIVNLVLSPNLEAILNLKNLPPICFITHIMECPCLFALQYKRRLPDYIRVMEQFRSIEKEIVELEEFKDKDDFTVVLQPFTEHFMFPLNKFNTTDVSYFSVDCFHLSQKGYARAANALWNNLMEPVGNKSTYWSKEFDRFVCPTSESPYIRTWKNSNTT